MKKFIINFAKFISLPALALSFFIFFYVKHDVYRDLYKYKNYSWQYSFQQLGDLSTKKLLNSGNKEYDSFIFGSSRAVSVYACYLQEKIPNSHFYHYANWAETIGGIYAKLKLIDSLGYRINNVFIYLDTDMSFSNAGMVQYNDHYLLTNGTRLGSFYEHFKSFMDLDEKYKIMFGEQLEHSLYPNWQSDIKTNDSRHTCSPGILSGYSAIDSSVASKKRVDDLITSGVLPPRDTSVKQPEITPYIEDILKEMKSLFEKNHTGYYIVITPLYDQKKFNDSDLTILRDIFGKNLYDFSGVNKYTENKYNYTDGKHFQYYISKEIIDSIIVN